MEGLKNIEQGFIIDRLTNSILNTISGDSFQTEVIRLCKTDLKHIAEKQKMEFQLESGINDREGSL